MEVNILENLDKVLEALSVVERYEEYLFQRAWGKALIIIGIAFPLGMFININIQILGTSMGLDVGLLLLVANLITAIVSWGLVLLVFYNAWQTLIKQPDQKDTGAGHGPVIAIIWFASFILRVFVPEPYTTLSILWSASIASILTYVVLKITASHVIERMLLYLGVMLGLISLPLLAVIDVTLSGYLTLIAFSVCFIITGLMMNQFAQKSLQKKAQ